MTSITSGQSLAGDQGSEPAAKKKQEFDLHLVFDISEKVYRRRLIDENGPGADERMVAKDKDAGEKLRGRARAYDPLTRAYLRVIGHAELLTALKVAKANLQPLGDSPALDIICSAIERAEQRS